MKIFLSFTAAETTLSAGGIQSKVAGLQRRGLTLIEIMIALTMTLIVLGAMMTAFQYASEQMSSGRALMELANRARTAESLLRSDLSGLTLEARPYTQTSTPAGYFEYVEGPRRDKANAVVGDINSYLGDMDDVLCMTVRSGGRAFRGRTTLGTPIVESPLAEVVWFTTFNDLDGVGDVDFEDSVRIHRRALLIRPDMTGAGLPTGQVLDEATLTVLNQFLINNDISVRVVRGASASTYDVFANNLTDLAERKNRYCHQNFISTANHQFPNRLRRDWLNDRRSPEDIILTDVAAFDLKVYSPNATVKRDSDMVVEPADPGYVISGQPKVSLGAFVDLGFDPPTPPALGPWFSNVPNAKSQCNYKFLALIGTTWTATALDEYVYDTWTPAYESDGINQDGDALTDEGTDGLDNGTPAGNGVDDTLERETLPPYPYPVRGMKISIRLIEKGTKQVHQSSIIQSFVPE